MTPLRVETGPNLLAIVMAIMAWASLLAGTPIVWLRAGWPLGLTVLVTSLAAYWLSLVYPRLQNWAEFGEQIRIRVLFKTSTFGWADIERVNFVHWTGVDDGPSSDVSLSLRQRGRRKKVSFLAGDFHDIVSTLQKGARSADVTVREAAAHGLGKLGCTKYYEDGVESAANLPRYRDLILSDLERLADDPEERVRAAAADAIAATRAFVMTGEGITAEDNTSG